MEKETKEGKETEEIKQKIEMKVERMEKEEKGDANELGRRNGHTHTTKDAKVNCNLAGEEDLSLDDYADADDDDDDDDDDNDLDLCQDILVTINEKRAQTFAQEGQFTFTRKGMNSEYC